MQNGGMLTCVYVCTLFVDWLVFIYPALLGVDKLKIEEENLGSVN